MNGRDRFELWESATTADLMDNPNKFGAPTFQQFKDRRSFYQKNHNTSFGNIEKGGEISNRFTKKQKYELGGYRCNSLEEVERVALNMGLDMKTLSDNYQAIFLPLGGGQADVLVKFMTPEDRQKRDQPNE